MTTVAYRDGVLASDSRVTGKGYLWTDKAKKVFRLPGGSLVGLAGDDYNSGWLLRELQKLAKENETPIKLPNGKFKGAQAILVDDKHVYFFGWGVWEKLNPKEYPYYSIGSGSTIAMSAMDAGASAVEAVNIAKKRDVYSGGRTQMIEVK